MDICVFCSASDNLAPIYYEETKLFGEWIGRNNHTLLYGGTSQGLMECLARSVKEFGGTTVAVLPKFMFDNGLASNYADDIILVEDLNERKKVMLEKADAFVALPGGFGTLDEVFYVVASSQIGVSNKKVILFSINDFYENIALQSKRAFDERFTPREYSEKLIIARSLKECIEKILVS